MGVLKKTHMESAIRPIEEKQWVRNIREKGDRIAFENIFRAYYKSLYHFAYSYVKDESAEDVVQTVFLNVWINREQWNPPGTVKQYLFKAVRNEALNMIRHKQVEAEAEEYVTRIFDELKRRSYSEEGPEAEKLKKAIQEGVEQLPPACRQIFLLNRTSGLTYAEIADVLEISFSTVSTQIGRALKHLRNHLIDYLPFLIILKLSIIGLLQF